ncbi:MAG: thioredoxin family protein [Actinobacteria bacterium]|nr:thioredoxin family protein [Actinomycetota bacterium]
MSEKIKVFWKTDCPKCPAAKVLVAGSLNAELFNLDEVDGLAEAAFYGIMSTPSIIITDDSGQEVASWRGEVPSKQAIEKWL